MKSPTSEIRLYQQAYGPHRPLVPQLIGLLQMVPSHVEVQAIAINGQTGLIVIETRHDDGDQVYAFQEEALPNGQYRWEPTSEERKPCSMCRGKGYVDKMIGDTVESADCPHCTPLIPVKERQI